jgi:hypothetical protein
LTVPASPSNSRVEQLSQHKRVLDQLLPLLKQAALWVGPRFS